MAKESDFEIPEAPSGLSEELTNKWKSTFKTAYLDAQKENPEHPHSWPSMALREANKVLRFNDPGNHEEAMAMPDWQFVHRKPSGDGKTLNVVTRHGKKFKFPIPANQQNPGRQQK